MARLTRAGIWAGGLVGGLLALTGLARIESIDSTNHCVETRYGNVTREKLPPGFTVPVFTEITCIPLTEQNYPQQAPDDSVPAAVAVRATTFDKVRLDARLSAVYQHEAATAFELFREKRRPEVAAAEVHRLIIEGFTTALAGWTLNDVYSPRQAELTDSIKAHIQRKLGPRTVIKSVSLRDLTIDPQLEAARKQAAQQDLELDRARKQLAVSQAEAEAQLVKARANAEQNRLLAESYASNPKLLQLKQTEALSVGLSKVCGQAQTCVVGSSMVELMRGLLTGNTGN